MTVGRILGNNDKDLGSGFALATSHSGFTRVVLTANHVLRDQEASSFRFLPEDKRSISVLPEDKRGIPVERVVCNNDLDVAVLHLSEDVAEGLEVGRAVERGSWQIETQPRPNDPKLRGTITDTHRRFVKQDGGHEIYVLQLYEQNNLGDYKGYSGSPVVLRSSTDEVIGVLIEQLRTRLSVPPGQPKPATNVLYAIPIQDVLDWLASLGVDLRPADQCPYRNLEAFTRNDAAFFFGRERILDELVKSLQDEPRFLAVLGPSGCGKSSLVQAGLLPQLEKEVVNESDRWEIIITRPTDSTFANIVTSLQEKKQHIGLIIDQFEELFTAYSEEECQEKVTLLMELLERSPRIHLILTLRNDFYSHFVRFEALEKWRKRGMVNVSPLLRRNEIGDIIQKPAEVAHLHFDDGLVEIIVNDVLATHSSPDNREPGAPNTVLPLLEFALTQLWERRGKDRGKLTLAAYYTIGGVIGGLKQWANEVYYALSEKERELARRVFTQLVYVNDETLHIPDSRKRISKDELVRATKSEQGMVEQVIQRLIEARLLVSSSDMQHEAGEHNTEATVEIIHDALLHEWRELRDWLSDDRRFLIWRQDFERQAQKWIESASADISIRDESRLLRGLVLAEAQGWLAERLADLTPMQQEYIRSSMEVERREKQHLESLLRDAKENLVAAYQEKAERLVEDNDYLGAKVYFAAALLNDPNNPKSPYHYLSNKTSPRTLAIVRSGYYACMTNYRVSFNQILTNHDGSIESVAFSPDSSMLASGGYEKIKIWDLQEQRIVASYKQESSAYSIAFSSTADLVAWASGDRTIRFWSIREKRVVATLSDPKLFMDSIAFSPDGHFLASTSGDYTVKLWRTEGIRDELEPVEILPHTFSVGAIAFSPNSKLLASASWGKIWLWDLTSIGKGEMSPTFIDVPSIRAIKSLAFSPNGDRLASGGVERIIRLWRMSPTEEIATFGGHSDVISSIAFSPGGHMLASASWDSLVRLWDVENETEAAVLKGHQNSLRAVAFSPNGKLLASAGDDRTIRLWNISADPIVTLEGHGNSVQSVAFSPNDSDVLASAAFSDGQPAVRIWSIRARDTIVDSIPHTGPLRAVTFSSNGEMIAFVGDNDHICIYGRDGKEICTFDEPLKVEDIDFRVGTGNLSVPERERENRRRSKEIIWSVAFSPDSNLVASTGRDNSVRLWNISDKKLLTSLKGKSDDIRAIAFSPNGEYIAAGTASGTVELWQLSTEQLVYVFSGHKGLVGAIAFSPDSTQLASGSWDETIKIWDVESRECVVSLGESNRMVNAVTFSPDGRLLLSADSSSKDKVRTISLWDAVSKELLYTIPFNDDVVAVSFDPDGNRFAAAIGENIRVFPLMSELWQSPAEELVAKAEREAGMMLDGFQLKPVDQ